MTEIINNKKRKIDDGNKDKKVESNYHPFVRSFKKKDVLPVSPNNYLINVKQLKQYTKDEKNENTVHNENTTNSTQKVQNQHEFKEHESFISVILL